MKKKIISAILMSTVILSAAAPLSGVYALDISSTCDADLIWKLLVKAQEKFGRGKPSKRVKKMRRQWQACKSSHHHHHH
nr:cLFchimera lactoferrin [synthetic construct]